jgi:hypothetical protein
MFRYRDTHGVEKRLINEAELLNAIRDGRIQASTPLAMGDRGEWGVAGRHPAFERAGKRALPRPHPGRRSRRAVLRSLLRSRRVAWGALVLAVLLGGFGVNANLARKRALAEQRVAYATAMLGLAEGRVAPAELVAQPAPEANDPALRTLWVRLQVAHTLWRSMQAAQAAHGIDGFLPPARWMSDEYVMNARAFPDIGGHWSGYLAWHDNWTPRAQDMLMLENERRAAEASLTERQAFELIDPQQPGLSAVGWDLELRRQFALEATRLHTALVESRGNVFIDEGKWWFADTRTQRAYTEHTRNLRRIGGLLRENAEKRAAAYALQPGDGVVPAGLTRMRAAGDLPSAR